MKRACNNQRTRFTNLVAQPPTEDDVVLAPATQPNMEDPIVCEMDEIILLQEHKQLAVLMVTGEANPELCSVCCFFYSSRSSASPCAKCDATVCGRNQCKALYPENYGRGCKLCMNWICANHEPILNDFFCGNCRGECDECNQSFSNADMRRGKKGRYVCEMCWKG
jgi:hypothetical protein